MLGLEKLSLKIAYPSDRSISPDSSTETAFYNDNCKYYNDNLLIDKETAKIITNKKHQDDLKVYKDIF